MNITEIENKHGIRVLLNNKPLTKRVRVKALEAEGISVKQYLDNIMDAFAISQCRVEVTHVNGSSFKYPSFFDYYLPVATDLLLDEGNKDIHDLHKSEISEEGNRISYDTVLAEHYQKWYDEEVAKNNQLRGELEETRKELNATKNDLELLTLRVNINNMQKDIKREREAKSGLNGIADALEKNVFLQELLAKVVESFTRPHNGGLNGIPELKDSAKQNAFTEAIRALANTTGDDEHFSLATQLLNKVTTDKNFAKKVLEGSVISSKLKLPSVADCL